LSRTFNTINQFVNFHHLTRINSFPAINPCGFYLEPVVFQIFLYTKHPKFIIICYCCWINDYAIVFFLNQEVPVF